MRFICICGCICALLPCGPNSICGFAKVHLWWRVGCICGFLVVHLWLGPLCTCAPVHLVRHTEARAWGEVVPTPGSTNLWLARGAPHPGLHRPQAIPGCPHHCPGSQHTRPGTLLPTILMATPYTLDLACCLQTAAPARGTSPRLISWQNL